MDTVFESLFFLVSWSLEHKNLSWFLLFLNILSLPSSVMLKYTGHQPSKVCPHILCLHLCLSLRNRIACSELFVALLFVLHKDKTFYSHLLVILWIGKVFFLWRVFRSSNLLKEHCESLEIVCLWFEKFQQLDFWLNVSCTSIHGPIMGLGLPVLCARVLEEDCYIFCREEVGRNTKILKILQFLPQTLLLPSMSCQLVQNVRYPSQCSVAELLSLQNVYQTYSVVPARCGKWLTRIILAKVFTIWK